LARCRPAQHLRLGKDLLQRALAQRLHDALGGFLPDAGEAARRQIAHQPEPVRGRQLLEGLELELQSVGAVLRPAAGQPDAGALLGRIDLADRRDAGRLEQGAGLGNLVTCFRIKL
jgi:hypothetical protein